MDVGAGTAGSVLVAGTALGNSTVAELTIRVGAGVDVDGGIVSVAVGGAAYKESLQAVVLISRNNEITYALIEYLRIMQSFAKKVCIIIPPADEFQKFFSARDIRIQDHD